MGIPKEHRILYSRDFESVRKKGIRRVYPYFILQLNVRTQSGLKANFSNVTRLGLIAGRRVGNAVIRNRGKRIIRQIFFKHKDKLPMGSELVVILRSNFQKSSFVQMEHDFLAACLWYKKRFNFEN